MIRYKKWILAGFFMSVLTLIYQVALIFQQTSPDANVNWLEPFDILLPFYAATSYSYGNYLWSKRFDLRVPMILIIFGAGSLILLFTFNDFLVSVLMPRIIAHYFLAENALAVFLAGILIPIYYRGERKKEEKAKLQI
jgi:hypothetical protein